MVDSVYIHIPFCINICNYCDFCKQYYNQKIVDDYLLELEKEIKEKYKNEFISTIYIGGGTPSCLNLNQLRKLFEIVNLFKKNMILEFTIECNIEDITIDKLELFKQYGVNRLSIGLQTTNHRYLEYLGRKKVDYKVKIKQALRYFNNISIDLMYAFQNQTLTDIKNDLDIITGFDIKHLSIYSLIIEEHTKLYIENTSYIDESLEEEMYFFIKDYLEDKGFIHYEISNFSKEGYQSKHNLTYWNNNYYYGFGLSSHGYINNIRYANTKGLKSYLNGNYCLEEEIMDKDLNMENEMILGLRKINGVSKNIFFNKFNLNIRDVFDIDSLINKGLLKEDDEFVFIPSKMLYVSNSILVNFIKKV